MNYTKKSFTLPTAPNASQENWDRAFLSKEEFEKKYPPIFCDWLDCDQPFSYRIFDSNLCFEHWRKVNPEVFHLSSHSGTMVELTSDECNFE